tara:strand:- start:3103 stop:3759 length:657 start_codon:yes stop_codon:yes gene_type:complete
MYRNQFWCYWDRKHNKDEYTYKNVFIDENLLEYIESLDNIKTFLDHGCGHGRISKVICDKFPNIDITVNDITPKAIEKTTELLHETKNLHSVLGGIQYVSGEYDCIISHRVIHSCPDYENTFTEIYRLLKKQGSCFISVRSLSDDIPKEKHRQWFNSKNNIIFKKIKGRFTKFFKTDEFKELITHSGLSIKNFGTFSELSAKSQTKNKYLYAICEKVK